MEASDYQLPADLVKPQEGKRITVGTGCNRLRFRTVGHAMCHADFPIRADAALVA